MARVAALMLCGAVAQARLQEHRYLATDIPCTPSTAPVPAFCADVIKFTLPAEGTGAVGGLGGFIAEAQAAKASAALEEFKITGFCKSFFGTKKFQCLKYMWECRGGKVFKLCESICKQAFESDIEACTSSLNLFEAQCKKSADNFGSKPESCDSHEALLFPKGGWGSGVILGLSLVGGLLVLGCGFWSCTRRMRFREALGRQMDAQIDDLDDGGAGGSLNNPQGGGVQMNQKQAVWDQQQQLDQKQRDIAAQQDYIRRLKAQVAEQEAGAEDLQLESQQQHQQQHDMI